MSDIDDLRRIALALPEVYEAPHFDKTSFRVGKKTFAVGDEKRNRATLKLEPDHQRMLFEVQPEAFSPAIWGKIVWTFVELGEVEPDYLEGLVRRAWEQVAPKRLIK
jgi:hypothetical protein